MTKPSEKPVVKEEQTRDQSQEIPFNGLAEEEVTATSPELSYRDKRYAYD